MYCTLYSCGSDAARAQESIPMTPPPPHQRGRGTHSPAGERVGESQFVRLEKKPSILSTLWYRGTEWSFPLYNLCSLLSDGGSQLTTHCSILHTYKGWLHLFPITLPLECGAWCCWQSWRCLLELTLYHSWKQWKQPWSGTEMIRFSYALCPPT